MLPLAFAWRAALLLVFLLAVGPVALAQRQYANRVVSARNTAHQEAAVDGQSDTQATLTPSPVAGGAALRLGLPGPALANQPAGLVLNTGGLLTLAALGGIAINTYLAPSTTPQQHLALGDLISLGLLNANQATVEFTASQPFDQIELVAGGLVNAYQIGVVTAYGTAAPLPVELVSFQGRAEAGGVRLSWQTASEINSHYVAVERATTAGLAFEELGRVPGAGSSAQVHRYEFVDAAPAPLGYYRLRQVDADGQAHFSAVVAVRAAAPTLAAYPSPATTTLLLTSPAAARLDIFDQQGRRLLQATAGPEPQPLDISGLPAGLYLVRDAATGQCVRFVKAP